MLLVIIAYSSNCLFCHKFKVTVDVIENNISVQNAMSCVADCGNKHEKLDEKKLNEEMATLTYYITDSGTYEKGEK